MSLRKFGIFAHQSAQPKVTQLDVLLRIDEDVGWLDVAVQHLPSFVVVALHQSRDHLCEYLPDDLLGDVVLGPATLLDHASHIPTRAVLHDDVDSGLFAIHDAVVVLDDVGVVQFAQDVDF